MILPKRNAENYLPPLIINEYDQIHAYIKQGKRLPEIKQMIALPAEQVEKMYISVLRNSRNVKDRKIAKVTTGVLLAVAGFLLIRANMLGILKSIQAKKGDENLYNTSHFYELQHPFWLLVFGLMLIMGLILLIDGVFSKSKI